MSPWNRTKYNKAQSAKSHQADLAYHKSLPGLLEQALQVPVAGAGTKHQAVEYAESSLTFEDPYDSTHSQEQQHRYKRNGGQ